jgi:hypothetical protein
MEELTWLTSQSWRIIGLGRISLKIKMKKFKIKIRAIKYFLMVMAFFVAIPVFASEFSFDVSDKNISAGEKFKVDLNINTEKESINAVEGKIIFSADLLELSEIWEGNSIANFWVEKPVYKDGGVVFSGITPGGYILNKGFIFSLVFTAKSEGNALIKIENVSALKNDGNGTPATLKTLDLPVIITKAGPSPDNSSLVIVDKTPPDTFKPEIAQDTNLFDNKWFIVFSAQDKGSDVASYMIKESKYNIFDFSSWVPAESPQVLADQGLKSNIYVKAIDKAGNERIVKLAPQNPIPWYTNLEDWFIIILVVLVVILYFRFVKKSKNNNEIF